MMIALRNAIGDKTLTAERQTPSQVRIRLQSDGAECADSVFVLSNEQAKQFAELLAVL